MDVCTLATCPITESIYQYKPSLAGNAALLAIFAASGIVHSLQYFFWRNSAFSIPMILGCLTEVIGYVGRVILADDPFSQIGFLIQICCLTLAPAFFSASIYFCLADIVRLFGEEASWVKPKHYAWIFIPCDIISLILQGTGGGLASVAADKNTDQAPGTNTMIAGLAFQVVTLLVFMFLTGGFIMRTMKARSFQEKELGARPKLPITRERLATFAIPFALAIITIFTRCVYRVAELSEGWEGELIHDEVTFVILEGVMIAIAVICLNIAHPKLLNQQ
ncbi:hypothetical protein FQN49_007690 [Arthroderma sp. PD_2]|nr:hypothetical protein FQN49_007690 [Arthroderma sp. PD_2]